MSKSSCTNKKPAEQSCLGFKEHFQTHFTHPDPSEEPPVEISNTPEFIKRLTESGISTDEDIEQIDLLTIHTPSIEEITKNIKKLKNKKASTDIPAEFLKAAMESESFVTALESLYRETWVDVVIPELWGKTTNHTIIQE